MIYFGCVVIIFLSGYVGKMMTKTLVLRCKFFKEMKNFSSYILNNLRYKQSKIGEIFNNYSCVYNNEFKKQLKNMYDLVEQNTFDIELELKNFYFLKMEERKEIVNFLRDMGKENQVNEINKTENLYKYLCRKSDEADEVRKKNEGLIYKISVFIGVIICILII